MLPLWYYNKNSFSNNLFYNRETTSTVAGLSAVPILFLDIFSLENFVCDSLDPLIYSRFQDNFV